MPKFQYRIYVIELTKRVYTENSKFRTANPQFNGVLQCLYQIRYIMSYKEIELRSTS